MNKKKLTICYILSLGHSGSTILDIELSKFVNSVGLGETYALLSRKKITFENTHSICSCGSSLTQCPFWSDVQLNEKPCVDSDDYKKQYGEIIEMARQFEYSLIIDSSKKTWLLDYLKDAGYDNVEIRPILLVRDVRGWAVSRRDLAKKEGRSTFLLYLRSLKTWYRDNKQFFEHLNKHGYKWLLVSYEEFALDTSNTIGKIADFLEVGNEQHEVPNTHILYGNRAKKRGSKSVTYDTRWFHEYKLNILLYLFFFIARLNRKLVNLPNYAKK